MYALGSISSYITAPFHPFGGAVDIIVVQQEDGSFKSSPWYVRFGKFQGVLKTREKVVNISVNGVEAGFHMHLDHKGEAYFLMDCDSQGEGDFLISSPPFRDEMDEKTMSARLNKSQSFYYDADLDELTVSLDNENSGIHTRTSSRRSRILGLMFGRRSRKENDQGGSIEMVNPRDSAELAAELLETNWSTNLQAISHRGDNCIDHADFDVSNDVNEAVSSYKEGANGRSETSNASGENLEEAAIRDSLILTANLIGEDPHSCLSTEETTKELVGSQDEILVDSVELKMVEQVHVEESFTHTSSSGMHKEVLEVFTSETGDFNGRSNTVSETVVVQSDEYCISSQESVLKDFASDARCSGECNISSQKVIYQEGDSDGISQEKVSRIEVVDFVRNRCQTSEEATLPSNSHVPLPNGSDQELKSLANEVKVEKPFLPNRLRNSQVESKHSKDEQFHFSDTEITSVEIKQEMPISNARGEIDDVEELDSEDSNNEECYESVSEVSGAQTSPLAVPQTNTHFGGTESFRELLEADSLTKSLPIIRSQIHDLERSNHFHPRSYSLDLNQDLLKNEISILSKLGTDTEGNKTLNNCKSEFAATAVGLENNHGDKVSHVQVAGGAIVSSGGSWRLWPFSLNKSKALSTVHSIRESTTLENVDAVTMRSQSMLDNYDIQISKFSRNQVQSLTPSSEQLASLNLKDGCNVIAFNFSTAMLGQQQVHARIYLWKWNTRIVISDVDGTITKSDVLGQFMPLVGKDWSHTGVTHLFSAIKENGYQLLFLSARSISQAYLTRQFLFNLKQDGKALPDGPVVISPDGLFPSLYREVIRRAPHEFKISCLEDIKALFPPECNPFYAGFGNRDTDELSYLRVGIPKGKIFIINPRGEVAVNRRLDTKSYTSLHAVVNGMFPPSTDEQEDFNSWNYWKLPILDNDI